MRYLTILFLASTFYSCTRKVNIAAETPKVNSLLDSLNATAARADFKSYFDLYADSSIFTGTDATERWNKQEFMNYAKPYFDKGHAWNFSSVSRHIYFDETGKIAWFDELLSTQMKICRGSGVVAKEGNAWKIRQYILSATVPNELMDSVVKIKTSIEEDMIKKLRDK